MGGGDDAIRLKEVGWIELAPLVGGGGPLENADDDDEAGAAEMEKSERG